MQLAKMAMLRRVLRKEEMSGLYLLLWVSFMIQGTECGKEPVENGYVQPAQKNHFRNDLETQRGKVINVERRGGKDFDGGVNNPRVVREEHHFRKTNPGLVASVNRDKLSLVEHNNGIPHVDTAIGPGGQPGMRLGHVVGRPGSPQAAAWPPASPRPAPGRRKPPPVKIAEHVACSQDVRNLCSPGSHTNNFAVLDCLQNDVKNDDDISKDCQHFLWQYKKNLTTDLRFDSAASEVCKDALKELAECGSLEEGTGHRISCLIENKANVSNPNCRQFLTKMASIVFSDYQLVYMFTEACEVDISKLSCGRMNADSRTLQHSQGHTIECLSDRYAHLDARCQHQIVRIAELQADDYHTDRPLFYACRDDREHFCQRTKAGGGKVYKCLYRHKFDRDMSEACRNKLVVRQTLTRESYKVNKALSDACRQDIRANRCLKGGVPSGFRQAKLAHVLLCLEGVMHKGKTVTPECVGELKEVRRSLMEDFKISPDIVTACASEIQTSCNGGLHREGKTLHCLMDLARPRRKDHADTKIVAALSHTCRRSLEDLLREADVGEDYTMDPALQEACQPVVDTACKNIKAGDAKVISCLMEKIGTDKMNDECEERLMEIQYFIARDFKLDPRLYGNCHKDAMRHCHGVESWADQTGPATAKLIFSCLYRHLKFYPKDPNYQLTRPCAFEVKRIMHQRAVSVELEPRIEEPCLADLGAFCSNDVEKGDEMRCLTGHFKQLKQDCKWAVGNYTEDIDMDPTLDRILMKSCTPMIKTFCSEQVNRDSVEPGEVMECLIKHKHSADMNRKCAVGIEHHQLVTLTDYQFSFKFKDSCKSDVVKLCRGVRRKAEVVRCLSEIHRNDTLLESKARLSRSCRKQLRFELLQRSENIRLDPALLEACRSDQAAFCANVSPGNAQVLECLKKNQKRLQAACARKLFKREKLENLDNAVDYVLMSTCKAMIKFHCAEERKSTLESCLRRHIHDDDFDDKCKKVLKVKHIRRNKDYRLNPGLAAACRMDIPKFCKLEVDRKDSDHLLEGKVINCLKLKFVTRDLSRDCEDHVRVIMKEAALNYKQDPVLAANCEQEIHSFCLQSLAVLDDDGNGGVEECLKRKFLEKRIESKNCKREILRIISETRADVHVDPLLHRACAQDIKHYCFEVPPGHGRQMSCLLHALEDKTVRLNMECRKMLRDRVNMWEYAAKVAPPESLTELLSSMNQSKSRSYFFLVILAALGIIFFGGLFCGRVTKRVRAEFKNK